MFATTEIRWFFQGEIPAEVQESYEAPALLPHAHESERIDYYLWWPGNDRMGIKLREGNIEMKHLKTPVKRSRFADHVRGYIGKWQKWSLTLQQLPQDLNEEPWGSWWIPLKKHRQLRKFGLLAHNDITEINDDRQCETACEWELCQIYHPDTDKLWWTVALEAFGEQQEYLLNVTAQKLFFNFPLTLHENYSYSYPLFINHIK